MGGGGGGGGCAHTIQCQQPRGWLTDSSMTSVLDYAHVIAWHSLLLHTAGCSKQAHRPGGVWRAQQAAARRHPHPHLRSRQGLQQRLVPLPKAQRALPPRQPPSALQEREQRRGRPPRSRALRMRQGPVQQQHLRHSPHSPCQAQPGRAPVQQHLHRSLQHCRRQWRQRLPMPAHLQQPRPWPAAKGPLARQAQQQQAARRLQRRRRCQPLRLWQLNQRQPLGLLCS